MNRRVRQLIIVAVVVVISTTILSWPAVLRYLIQSGLQQARRSGQHLSWSGLSTGMKSLSLDSLTVWVPSPKIQGSLRIPLSIDLQEVTASLKAADLFMLRPTVIYQTSLYGGSIKGDAHLAGATTEVSATLENIEVGKHPQIGALGIRGGTINAVIDRLAVTPSGPVGGTFSLSIRHLSPPAGGAAKTLLKIDDLGPLDLDTAGTVTQQSVELSNVKLVSNFGEVSGQIIVRNHLSKSPLLSGDLRVSLSEQGSSTLGPWLPLIPGAGLDSTARGFLVRIATLPCAKARADAVLVNFGDQCAKLSFSRG
jgi:hypothetical protein